MRKLSRKAGIAAGLATAAFASLTLTGAAQADSPAPRPGDVVGVGSDTLQNGVNFVLDGAPGVAGGYNAVGNRNRVFSFDATGDASGRAIYDVKGNSLPGTVILRAGTNPVTRPNGSGSGVAALIKDSGSGGQNYGGLQPGAIQFARMSRYPKSSEFSSCATSDAACGGLHVYQIATDKLSIAVQQNGGTNAVPLSIQQLVKIYNCTWTTWGQVPNYNGPAAGDTIIPLLPQSGSGTHDFFLADLAAAAGTSSFSPGSCVGTVQEHDPSGIAQASNPKDAIEPFSAGKISLLNSGYFTNTTGAAAAAYQPNYLTTLSGTATDGNAAYNDPRGLYIAIRNVDLGSSTPMQPGGTANWATTLFAGADSWFARSQQAPLLAAAGWTQAYKDCGVNQPSC